METRKSPGSILGVRNVDFTRAQVNLRTNLEMENNHPLYLQSKYMRITQLGRNELGFVHCS